MDSLSPPVQTQGTFFTSLLISLSCVVAASLTLLAYHFLFVKYCIRRQQRRLRSTISIPVAGREMGGVGVEEHVLKSIPILKYSKEDKNNNNNTMLGKVIDDQSECVICLGELEEGDKIRSLPNCGHIFHVPCIDDWFLAHTNCPICRAPIAAPVNCIASVLQESISGGGRREWRNHQALAQFLEQRDEDSTISDGGGNCNASTSRQSSARELLVRHSLSLVLPMDGKQQQQQQQQQQRFMGLKRSLSMDQSYVIIDIQGDQSEKGSSSSSLLKGIVMEHRSSFRTTSRLLTSFSLMRQGQQSYLPSETSLPC